MYMTADEWSEFANILEFEDGEDVHYITIRMGDGGVLKQSVDVGKTYTYTVCADVDGKDMTSLLMDDQFSTPVITGNAELNVVFKQIDTNIKETQSMSGVKVYASNKKVIVTGVGKSGHIGAKIAATFASTGTPSFFINPLDVFHGDLGVMAQGDVVLAISNSGQTDELLRFIPMVLHMQIPIIGMSGNPENLG